MRKTLVSGLIALGAGIVAVGIYLRVFLPWLERLMGLRAACRDQINPA